MLPICWGSCHPHSQRKPATLANTDLSAIDSAIIAGWDIRAIMKGEPMGDKDTIYRQAAIEIIQSMYSGMPRVPWMRKDWQKRYEPYIRTENAIRKLPSAQPERKTGRWIHERLASTTGGSYPVTRCSACQNSMPFEWEAKYCPNCGAYMGEDT